MSDKRWEWSVRFGGFGGIAMASLVAMLGTGWWTIALIAVSLILCAFSMFKAIFADEEGGK